MILIYRDLEGAQISLQVETRRPECAECKANFDFL
jgi:hypothetical protein